MDNIVGHIMSRKSSTNQRFGIDTISDYSDAVKIIGIGIDQCSIGHSIQPKAGLSLILRRAVQPYAVKDNVIRGTFASCQTIVDGAPGSARDLQSHQPVVV